MIDSTLIPPEGEVPALVSAAQLAEWLKISARTVQNWTRAGILPKPVILSPRKIFYRTEEVREALRELETATWSTTKETSNGKT